MADSFKNILFLTSWYPNPDAISNGIFIKRHAQSIATFNKVTVLFAKSVSGITENKLVRKNQNNFNEVCFFYPKYKLNIPFVSNLVKLWKFKKEYKNLIDQFLLENDVDIVHVNVVFPAVFPALYVLRQKPNAKLFITEHWSGYYPEDGNYKGKFLINATKQLCARARAIFVISEKLKQSMKSHGLIGNYEVINNVVDTTIFKPVRHVRTNGQLKILHVSSLVEREKNISGIIETITLLKKSGKEFFITIVGGGLADITNYQKQVNENGLKEHVYFAGHRSPEEVAELMNDSDVFLLMSHYEGMPVVVLESISCGLPVISTDVGEVKHIVPSKMGNIIPVRGVDAACEILFNFKREDYLSPDKMHNYILSGFSPESVGLSINNLYSKYMTNDKKNS